VSKRQEHLRRIAAPAPGLTPFESGKAAYNTVGSLKGLPYGPGWRQEEYIRGFYHAVHAPFTDEILAELVINDTPRVTLSVS
jgi:hypothetical protein